MTAKSKRRRLTVTAVSISLFILFCIFAFDTSLATTYYNVKTDKISGGIRIALIADLHSCYFGDGQKELVDVIENAEPDLVLLAGDIIDENMSPKNVDILFKAIADKYPCYYVTGNHEIWSGEADEIKSYVEGYGITVLQGDCCNLMIREEQFSICGVDDPEIGEDEFDEQLNMCGMNSEASKYKILLAHRPDYIGSYLQYDFDLILSGHTHGGQWRIPGILNGVYSPGQGFFPKYAGGHYRFGRTDFIVSRGLAKESTRVPRIFNPPELVVIDVN